MTRNAHEMKFIETISEENLNSMTNPSLYEMKNAAKHFSHIIEKMVNNFSFEKMEMVKEILNSPSAAANTEYLCMAFIKRLADCTENWMYDGRNQESVKKAKEICSTDQAAVSAILKENSISCEAKKLLDLVADYMVVYTHRTLQQTFAGFCFCFLYKCRENKKPYYAELLASMDEGFYSCCLI